jgi:hypothetical protein
MKAEIYKSDYAVIEFEEDKKLMSFAYFESTFHMDDAEWQAYILKIVALSEQYQPKYLLSDSRKRHYIIGIEMQEWMAVTIAPCWMKVGVQKYAQIVAEEYITDLATQQTVEEAHKKNPGLFETRFFHTYEDATSWLFDLAN